MEVLVPITDERCMSIALNGTFQRSSYENDTCFTVDNGLAPVAKLVNHSNLKIFSLIPHSNDVLRSERKDNSDGKTMFGLFLFINLNINMISRKL